MELPTLTSWLELTTGELPLSPTVLRSPPTMAGPTLSGILTPWPTILPSLSFHPPLTSTTTLLHHACPWQETLVMKAGMKAAGQAWNQVGIVSFGSSAGCEVGYP